MVNRFAPNKNNQNVVDVEAAWRGYRLF